MVDNLDKANFSHIAELRIENADITAVLVSTVETALKKEDKKTQIESAQVKKELEQAKEERSAKLVSIVAAHSAKTTKAATKLLKKLGFRASDSLVTYATPTYSEDTIRYLLILMGKHASTHIELPIPKELKDLIDKANVLQEKKTEIDDKLLEIRKNLSDVPSIERQARAALAKKLLSGDDNGRLFLESFGSTDIMATVRLLTSSKSTTSGTSPEACSPHGGEHSAY